MRTMEVEQLGHDKTEGAVVLVGFDVDTHERFAAYAAPELYPTLLRRVEESPTGRIEVQLPDENVAGREDD